MAARAAAVSAAIERIRLQISESAGGSGEPRARRRRGRRHSHPREWSWRQMVIGVAGWRRRRRRPPRSRQPHLVDHLGLKFRGIRRLTRAHVPSTSPAQGTSGACAGLRCLRAKLRGQRALRWAGCAPCALRRAVRHFGLVCPFRLVHWVALSIWVGSKLNCLVGTSDLPTFLLSWL